MGSTGLLWDDLGRTLDVNPVVGPADAAMADQARPCSPGARWTRRGGPARPRGARPTPTCMPPPTTPGGGRRRERLAAPGGAGAWGTDWFGRAQAAVIYIYVNDYREALYFVRGTDAAGALLKPPPLHHDVPGGGAAAGRPGPGRVLVADHVRQGLLHAGAPNGGTTSAPCTSTRTS